MATDRPAATATPCSSRLRASVFVWLFLALRLSLRWWRAIASALHLLMMLSAHLLLMMQPAHLLLMMQRTHLLLMMLSGHLLLMMLNIHLLLMIHRLLPMSGAFVLDSFFVHRGLVSFCVVIVAVKVFCLVFVPVFSGIHPFSLSAVFSHLPWLVFTLSRSSCASRANGLSTLTLPRAFALACAFALVERLDRFLVRFPLVRRSEEVFIFGCRLLTRKLL